MDIFWNIFEKSGSIDAFMAHKEYERSYRDMTDKNADNSVRNFVVSEKIL
ncbi:MAG: hypothetical protein IJ736_11760 [Firmicutes bacterium]|nr:hypothetical protein [Bacillota bacterium]